MEQKKSYNCFYRSVYRRFHYRSKFSDARGLLEKVPWR
uniref:Uncharacterized protein n=1 Tax=Pristionchus pacificus TaxID=54126 RepID=A0A2A6BHC7_PRIPA|eukprot:PDM65263.1 hypothetical protein PRIPAC_52205 [Pristionchus pacificus]